MPKFVTIGYGDQAGYDRTAAPLRDAAHAHDARLCRYAIMTLPASKRRTRPICARPCRWLAFPSSRRLTWPRRLTWCHALPARLRMVL